MGNQVDSGDGRVLADRAGHEPSPAVSAVPVTIPRAIARALDPVLDRAEREMSGNRVEFLAWREARRAIPTQVLEAIWAAGYTLTPLGGNVQTNVRVLDGGDPWQRNVRAEMQMPSIIAYAERRMPAQYLGEQRYLRDYLPRELAAAMWAVFEKQVEADLSIAISRAFTSDSDRNPQGEDA